MTTDTGEQPTPVRVAAMADLHVGRTVPVEVRRALEQARLEADVLVLCGDLTDRGLEEEAELIGRELAALGLPVAAVLGNHDYESGHVDAVIRVLTQHGVHVLDGDSVELAGVGIAGVKGFGGGFGRRTLGSWGEPAIKAFVQEAVDEALKLERALTQLHSSRSIALLHYAPICGTVEGEAAELFPFLGSSRLEEPLTRYPVSAVLHGHAHHGTFEGRTTSDVPVYNVSAPVLLARAPEAPPLHLLVLP
jgi:Icc-related predicted phosphoesterase